MKVKDLQWKRALRTALLVLLMSAVGMMKMYAYDFNAVCETGQTLYYNITDAENHYVKLTYPGTTYYDWWGYTKPTGDIVLPESVQYDGITYSVTSIGSDAFYYCSGLTTIEIPNTVTSIGDNAFYYCSGLTTIEIPNTVTSIGSYTFSGCSDLTTIEIPNSVTYIGSEAFSWCNGLIIIEIPNSVTSIGSSAFMFCSSLISIEIPSSITIIENSMFYGCSGLTTIEIPNSVTMIANQTFSGCSGLTSIEIPNSITSIGDLAFSDCSGLTTIEIPNSVTSIGSSAFYGCSGLEQIIVDSGNMVYDSRDNCNAIINTSSNELVAGCKNTVIPNTVTSIGNSAFSGCSSLTSIEIPNSVNLIGSSAFYGCSGLEQIIVDSGNTVYDSRDNCNAIINTSTNELVAGCKNTVIPNTVNSISSRAFSGCSGLTSIEIPNTVTSIGSNAFSGCCDLTSIIVLADNPPILGDYVFYGVNKFIPVYVPCGNEEAYTTVNWSGFNKFVGLCAGEITVIANLAEGGTVIGGGYYEGGATCTLTATVNEGYVFMYWTENGTVVSFDNPYSFPVGGDRNLVANFAEGEACGIAFDFYAYPSIGGEGFDPYKGRNNDYVVINYGDDNSEQFTVDELESVSFSRVVATGSHITLTWIGGDYWFENSYSFSVRYEDSGDLIYETNYIEPGFNYSFDVDCSGGNVTQTITLSQGWNWFSTYLDITLDDLKTVLVEALPDTTITIKSQTQNIKYQNGRWTGSLTTLDKTRMYMISVTNDCEISLVGMPINPSTLTVTINNGANWIAFPYNQSMTVTNFFGSFPVNNDQVKSQSQNARYQGNRWGGQLNTLVPGKGYMYISNTQGTRTFTFPASAK